MEKKIELSVSAPDIDAFESKVKELSEHASRCRELIDELNGMELKVTYETK